MTYGEKVVWTITIGVLAGVCVLAGVALNGEVRYVERTPDYELSPAFGEYGETLEEGRYWPQEPIYEDVFGPNKHQDGTGQAFEYVPDLPAARPDMPFLKVDPDTLGPNRGTDQYGRPVIPRQMEYLNLDELTTDPYVEKNEGLQPEYDQNKAIPNVWPLECGIERETPISTYMSQEEKSNGLTIYFYDTNSDGKADVQIYVPIGDANRYPLFYSIDRDFDGETAEITYIDEAQDGTCSSISVYWTKSKGFLKPEYKPNYKEGA